jgi:hypothetical protein
MAQNNYFMLYQTEEPCLRLIFMIVGQIKGEVMKWAVGLAAVCLEEETKVIVEKTRYICAVCI